MTKCSYHALQDTYKMMEEQLSDIGEKIADLKINLDINELDIDLDNIESQMTAILNVLEGYDFDYDFDSIEADLSNIKDELITIGDNIEELNLNVTIDDNLDTNLDSIETQLSDIKTEITNLIDKVDFTNIESQLNEISNQLKISNQIAILNSIDEYILDNDKKQAKYMALKIALFGSDDPVDSLDDDDTHHGTSDPVTPQPTTDLTDDDNPILNP